MPLNLADLRAGDGFVLNAPVTDVAAAGDVNGDGFADVIFGQSTAGGTVEVPTYYGGTYTLNARKGAAYVVFGRATAPAVVSVASLDGERGFVVSAEQNGAQTGNAVAGAGDINGDGFADLVIGAPGVGTPVPTSEDGGDYRSTRIGGAYVLYGAADGFAPVVPVGTLRGDDGATFVGSDAYDSAGAAVAVIGDINGDGFADFALGAPEVGPIYAGRFYSYSSQTGEVYILFGSASGRLPARPGGLNGTNGFALEVPLLPGIPDYETIDQYTFALGHAVAAAGDLNGDGLADLIVGAPRTGSGTAENTGAAYVVFGSNDGFAARLQRGELDGSNGFALIGALPGSRTGQSVATAGDVNADGIDDLLIDSLDASYIVYGRTGGFPATLDLARLNAATGVVLTTGATTPGAGISVAGIGDVNGDRVDDILIGRTGTSFLVLGRAGGLGATIDLDRLDASRGLLIEGGSGVVAGLGDVNGDGYADFAIGAQVVYGGPALFALSRIRGTAGDDVLTGGDRRDEIFGFDGNDTLRGLAGGDVLRGGPGNDAISGGAGSDEVFGAAGRDTLTGGAGNDAIDGGDGRDRLTGGDGHDLLQAGRGDDRAEGGNGDDRLEGSAGDDVMTGGAGADTLAGGAGRDRLDGGAGNDTLVGGPGNDRLQGGAGDDQIDASLGADRALGGAGSDWIIISDDTLSLDGGAGRDRLTVQGAGGVSVNLAASSVEWATGGAGNDVLNGKGARDLLLIDGGRGDDWLTGGSGNDFITATAGADRVAGGAGDDTMHLNGRFRALDGGGGRDAVFFNTDRNVVLDVTRSHLEEVTGDAGNDRLDGTGSTAALGLIGGAGNDVLTGGRRGDTLDGDDGHDRLFGGDGPDTLFGGFGEGDDWLAGGRGADYMAGNPGNDTYVVDHVGDRVEESAWVEPRGIDTVLSSVSYTLTEWVERLQLTGSAAIDGTGNELANWLTGNAAANRLTGLAGGDRLEGGAGNDVLAGGGGRDRFVFASTLADGRADLDRITDYSARAGDRIALTGGVSVAEQSLVAGGAMITFSTGDQVLVAGIGDLDDLLFA
jgi:Ca2+-binding RTX toxin-like protein